MPSESKIVQLRRRIIKGIRARKAKPHPICSAVLVVTMKADGLRVRKSQGANFLALKQDEAFEPNLLGIKHVIILRSSYQISKHWMSEPQKQQILKWAEKMEIKTIRIAYDYQSFKTLLGHVSNYIKVTFSPAVVKVSLNHGHAVLAPPPKHRVPTRRRKVSQAA